MGSYLSSFNSKASSLKGDLSYAIYKELQFGNYEKVSKYERALKNIKSIGWLLKASEGCTPALCGGATSYWDVATENIVTDTLNPGLLPQWNEVWKGNLYNSKLGKEVSLVTFTATPFTDQTGIRIYEWNNGVATLIYEEDGLFQITYSSYVSFYYSEDHNAYYIKAGTSSNDASSPTLFKVDGAFTAVTTSVAIGAKGNTPADAVMEVADCRNLIFVREDANTITALSLNDLSVFKTIDTTGYPYQKMTFDENTGYLFLTGQGSGGNAVVHQVDVNTGVITTKLDDATLRNNTSFIMNDGTLLVLTSGASFPDNTIQFQKWDTCDNGLLIDTFDTGIPIGALGPDFFNLLALTEDKNGNIYVTYVSDPGAGATTALSVFDKDFNLLYTKQLPPIGVEFGVFSANFTPNWTNTNVDNPNGAFYVHSGNQNGSGGTYTYYLDYDYKDLVQTTSVCFSLTDEDKCNLINQLDRIEKPKRYSTPTNGINSNISYLECCNKLFIYKQTVASATWTIIHNLDSFPVIITVDENGGEIIGSKNYVDNNTVIITFTSPVKGTAYLTHNIQ